MIRSLFASLSASFLYFGPCPVDLSALDRIVRFLLDIGLDVRQAPIPCDTFLPGIHIERGCIRFAPEHLISPGDLLHEAGHLAVVPSHERACLTGDNMGFELGAIAWSYAACVHLGLPPEVVFHEHGYKGESAHLMESLATGRYIGVPILIWRGMTESDTPASPDGPIYPEMRHWLCA